MSEVNGGLRWPDLVLRGSLLVVLAVVLIQFFSSESDEEEVRPQPDLADDAEIALLAKMEDPEAVWTRVAFTLRQFGHIRTDATPTLSDIRRGIKSYQHAIGGTESGRLDPVLLTRILDEEVEFPPYLVREAVQHGRWFLAETQEQCELSAAASRIKGRLLTVERPVIRLRRMRHAEDADEIHVSVAEPRLFNVSTAISFMAGGERRFLHAEGDAIVPVRDEGEALTRWVVQGLRVSRGEVQTVGMSVFGGPLLLSFPTVGFEDAYRAMAAACGDGILHWIED
ncbi:hypothetical protein [Hyphomicrobium sp.]|uniref:hypothetical protein n=1 Tax=Hyphomicrobium sp. TaxID=82 RepID=UPI002FDD6DE6